MTTPDDVARRARASVQLRIGGVGDDLAAASLHRSAEGLLSCGVVAELTVDLSALDDAYPSFVTTLARLTTTARAHGCELFLVGLHRPAVLVALDEAPLDELFAVYQAACHHDTAPITVPPVPGRSAVPAWMPEPTTMTTSMSAQGPVASAAPWGASADATGAPRDVRADHGLHRSITSQGAEMTSDDDTTSIQRSDRDRLVELHVLAANGDATASAQADKWMADDPVARRIWDSVARTCDELGASSA